MSRIYRRDAGVDFYAVHDRAIEELVHLVHHAARRGRGRGRVVGLGLFSVGHCITCAESVVRAAFPLYAA